MRENLITIDLAKLKGSVENHLKCPLNSPDDIQEKILKAVNDVSTAQVEQRLSVQDRLALNVKKELGRLSFVILNLFVKQ
jgi:hypothetical protein